MHTKSSQCISPHLSLAMFATSLVWTLYGHAKRDMFMAVSILAIQTLTIRNYLIKNGFVCKKFNPMLIAGADWMSHSKPINI